MRPRRLLRSFLILLIGCGLIDRSHGQEPPAPRVDAYGDALPAGAVARLGTTRFVHLGGIASVALSPDGKVVASGGASGEQVHRGENVVDDLSGLKFSAAVNLTRSTIRIWDAQDGKLLRIATPDAPVSAMLIAPDGHTLFAGCGRVMCSWDLLTGKKLWQIEAIKEGRFNDATQATSLFIAGGKVLSTHCGSLICPGAKENRSAIFYHPQNVVRYWDAQTGKVLPVPTSLESAIKAEGRIPRLFHEITISPDLRFAAVLVSEADPERSAENGISDHKWLFSRRRLELIHIDSGKVVKTIADEKGLLHKPVFRDDGGLLALAADRRIWLMRTENGEMRTLTNGVPPAVAKLIFFAAGTQLAAMLDNDAVHVWDAATGDRVGSHIARKLTFESVTRGKLSAAARGFTVRLFHQDTGKDVHTFGHRLTPSVRFGLQSPDLLLSHDSETAYRWQTDSWKARDRFILPAELSARWWRTSEMDLGVSVEKLLYVKDCEKRLELRDLKTGRLVRALSHSAGKDRWCYFSANGSKIVAHDDGYFHFYDTETGKLVGSLERSKDLTFTAYPHLSANGTYFAKSDYSYQAEFFAVKSGEFLRKAFRPFAHRLKPGRIFSCRFSNDEQLLLGEVREQLSFENGFSEEKSAVVIWDVKYGRILQEITILPGTFVYHRSAMQQSEVMTLTLSSDRRLLALARPGKTVELWETASGTKRGEFAGHDAQVVDLAFSHDGRLLASSSEDTTILVWDLNRPLHADKFKDRLGADELAAHWTTLLQPDAKKADTAIWSLVRAAPDSVPFLRKQLPPVARPDAKRVREQIAALGNDDFDARAAAADELAGLGELVLPELEAAHKANNNLETRRRLEALLKKAHEAAMPFGTAERIRQWRAIEVLEWIGSADAQRLLTDLAAGASSGRLTITAGEAQARLKTPARQPK